MRFARVSLMVFAGAVIGGLAPTGAARAESGAAVTGGGSDTPTVEVSTGGSQGGSGGGSSSGAVHCQYYEADMSVGSAEASPEPGKEYQLICWDRDGAVVYSGFVVYDPAEPAVSPSVLARRAWQELPLTFPAVQTSPPHDSKPQVVGLPTWMWVQPSSWTPQQATADVPGISATVTATPSRIDWNMGDGNTVTCTSGGVPYDVSRAPEVQATDCSYNYKHASSIAARGVFEVEATMWWTVTWSATNGASGSLPDAYRTTRFDLEVREFQAVRQ